MPPCSTRSSVSSMNSMSSMSSTSLTQQYNPNNNLNHALAVVTNQLEREQRKHDQEATRKLTLLRQRKISAVLKVNIFDFMMFFFIEMRWKNTKLTFLVSFWKLLIFKYVVPVFLTHSIWQIRPLFTQSKWNMC